jgi:putative PIN family toxin of toxin-antitoxin system
MRVTLDTNVLVSAFISKHGRSAHILDVVATFDEITLVLSEDMLEEFADVMDRNEVRKRFGYTKADVSAFEGTIRGVAEMIRVTSNFRVIEEDPDDDVVVNTAYDGKADYIVSGDKHLRKLRSFKGIRIVTASTFMGIILKTFGDLILLRINVK